MRNAILTLLLFGLLAAGANPAAFWEGLTAARLRGSAVGPELWTPADLGDDLVQWLRSSDSNRMGFVSGEINTWTNSVSDAVFTATSALKRPGFVADALNGYPVVRIGGNDHGLYSGTNDLRSISGASSFVVVKLSAVPSGFVCASTYSDGSNVIVSRWRFGMDSSQRFRLSGRRLDGGITQDAYSPTDQPSINTNNWLLYTGVMSYSDAQFRMYANGVQVSTNDNANISGDFSSDTASLRAEVFTYSASDTFNMEGDYTDVITVRRALTATEVQKLEGWSAHRYALTALLPADHPHKSAPPTK